MKNMRRWKRLLAVGMCSAMMFSMSVGVSATENQDTEETNVEETKEEEETATEDETALKGDSGAGGNVNDKPSQVGGEVSEEATEKVVEPKSAAEVAETEENSDDLPEVPWNDNFTVSHNKGDLEASYKVVLGDEWKLITVNSGKEPSNYKEYMNGVLMESGRAWSADGFFESFQSKDLTGEPIEITYEIDRLEHYSGGKVDGIAKNVRISFETEVEESEGNPCMLPTALDYDGTQDLVFKFKDGVGDRAIKDITSVTFDPDQTVSFWIGEGFTYDVEAGTLTLGHVVLNNMLNDPFFSNSKDKIRSFDVYIDYTDKGGVQHKGSVDGALWKVNYLANQWGAVGEKPQLIKTSHEFNGTEDMVFNFKNGTGDNAIESIEQVVFNIKGEPNNTDENGSYLANFFIGNYGVSFDYDIEKGQVTLFKHAVSALVHSEDRKDWVAVDNVYGNVWMTVKLANGKTGTVFYNGEDDWTVTVREKSPEASNQITLEYKKEYSVDDMQNLVDFNKENDIILRTPEGITFSFAKGTMHMVEGKDSYPLGGVEIIAKFSDSGIKNKNVTSDTFVCRINFEYSGELPGTPKISIPVDNKWNGKTLYYYQVMEDGSLKDTGMSGKVEDGIFDVLQSHCSDYVLLTQSPKELGVTENTGNGNGNGNDNTGNGNNQSGNGNTQGSSGNSNTQVKPADTTKASPKTGDNHMFLLFVVLCVGSCAVGVSTLKARRRTR